SARTTSWCRNDDASTRSGRRRTTSSTSARRKPPICGSARASGGKLQWRVTAASRWPAPSANSTSVLDGASETMRMSAALVQRAVERLDAVGDARAGAEQEVALDGGDA